MEIDCDDILPDVPPVVQALESAMTWLGEYHWHRGDIIDHEMWDDIHSSGGRCTAIESSVLRALYESAGVWLVYDADARFSSVDASRIKQVSLDDWRGVHAAWRETKRSI